jgi:hypothetical protein
MPVGSIVVPPRCLVERTAVGKAVLFERFLRTVFRGDHLEPGPAHELIRDLPFDAIHNAPRQIRVALKLLF